MALPMPQLAEHLPVRSSVALQPQCAMSTAGDDDISANVTSSPPSSRSS
jgi:hypothetical protein